MSRSRTGLPPSYHGNPSVSATDFVVQTEYGADAWQHPMIAGFDAVTIHTVDFPTATAFKVKKHLPIS
jgi:hypothetical protein